MRDGWCLVCGSGQYGEERPDFGNIGYVIAADGGYEALAGWGRKPDLLVGDFDSLGSVPQSVEVIRHPVMKDDTDMALALAEGAARGWDRFLIYGGLGGRLDHTLGNIQLLVRLSRRGGRGILVGAGQCVTAITNRGIRFPGGGRGYFSVFAWGGEARGVSERGAVYSLDDAVLYDDMPRGVSNEFSGELVEIQVRQGTLVITWECGLDTGIPEIYNLPDTETGE